MASSTHAAVPPDSPAPGWYGDPAGLYEVRWWTGLGWSAYARAGTTDFYAPLPGGAPGGDSDRGVADELSHLEYLEHFLNRARADGAIDAAAYQRLTSRMVARREPAVAWLLAARAAASGAAPSSAARVPAGAQAPVLARSLPVPAPAPAPAAEMARPEGEIAAPVPPERREPSAARRWWQRKRETVRSDLTVNGLAYLGVLLLFAGLFGVVAFSFSSVQVGLRPVAEVVVPAAVFGSAWFLRRRGLVVPARALTLLGGLLVPIAGFSAFADQAPVPPDLSGVPLVVALTSESVAVAVAYALWSRRQPSSPLRYLVAPALWLAVAAAALGFHRPIPFGQDIVVARPGQYAAVLVAIASTLAASRRWASRPHWGALSSGALPAALVGLGIAGLLEGLTAGVAGWPAGPIAVAGSATLLALDLSDRRVPAAPIVVLEGLVVAVTGLGLAPALGAGWAGASATVAGVAVIERALRRGTPGPVLLVPVMVTLAALVTTAVAAGPAVPALASPALLVAGVVTSAWVHARRLWPGGWPYPAWLLTAGAAVAPASVLAGLLTALPAGAGVAVAGLAVLAGSGLARFLARRDDQFMHWWLPTAAVAVLAVTAGRGGTAWLVVAAASAAGAIVMAPGRPAPRVWLAGPAVVWTAWLGFDVAEVGFDVRLLGIAAAAVVAVGFAAVRRDVWAGQVGVLGHLAGLACWPLAVDHAGRADAAAPTAVLGLATAGLIITTAAQEAGRGTVADVLVWCGKKLGRALTDRAQAPVEAVIRRVPAVAAAVALLVLALNVGAVAGLSVPSAWRPVAVSALAVSYLLLALALRPWRRVARVLADVGFGAAVLAAILCTHRDPALVALAAVMVAPVLSGPAHRRLGATWAGWAASVPFVVLAADLAGLPAPYWYAVTLGWGSAALLGGLGVERVGRRRPAETDQAWWQSPPVLIGVAASLAGLLGSPTGSGHQAGWALIAAGTVTVAVGVLLRVGALGGVGAAMAVAGLVAVAQGIVTDRPWLLLLIAAALLVAAAIAASRTAAKATLWRRFDVPLFVVAHGVAAAAMGLAAAAGSATALTIVGGGGLAAAVAARLRRWPWAVAGALLILAGAGYAGPGWECLALAAVSATATVLAVRRHGWLRAVLLETGAVAAAGTWAAGLIWRGASLAVAVEASSIAAGAVILIAAAGLRISGAARDWARAWGGTAVAAVAAAAIALADPAVPSGPRLVVAAALAATAIGCGLAAQPLDVGWLREAAAAAAGASAVVLVNGTAAKLIAIAWGAMAAGLIAAAVALMPWTRRSAPMWARPSVLFAAAATVAALVAGVLALPDRALIVPALLLTGVLILTLAAWLRRPGLAAATPVPLCAAWLAYASAALAGQPQWFTVPAGAALIGAAALLRSARRSEGRPVDGPDVTALEVTGMGLVMGASLVQSVTTGPLFGLVGVGLAILLTCWGALTRVRRRLLGGAIAVGAALLLLLAVPLARLAPHWGGVAAWLALAGVGLIAIVVAALLDASRAAVRRGMTRFSELTSGWE
jgi:hypothetical protein